MNPQQQKLLEGLYARYDEPKFFPTFEATWVEQEDGRRYFRVTGDVRGFSGEMNPYDRTHSRGDIEELEQEGYITRVKRGDDEYDLKITEAGKALAERFR